MGYLDKLIPTLEGEDAERFLKLAEENEKHAGSVDFSEQIERGEKVLKKTGMYNNLEDYISVYKKIIED